MIQRDELAKEIEKRRALTRSDALEITLVGIGRIEGDPEKQEPCIFIPAAGFGPSDPADRSVDAQAHRFREPSANSALLVFQGAETQAVVHRAPPLEISLMASHRSRSGDSLQPWRAVHRAR